MSWFQGRGRHQDPTETGCMVLEAKNLMAEEEGRLQNLTRGPNRGNPEKLGLQGVNNKTAWEHTTHGGPHKGDDVVAVREREAPAAPEEAEAGSHPPRPFRASRAPQHLAAPQMVHRHYICAGSMATRWSIHNGI